MTLCEINLWLLPIEELRERLKTLNHAGSIEYVIDSEGRKVNERRHHYLGCTRCLIEGIIQQREMYEKPDAHPSA